MTPKIFISYSWSSPEHQEWVINLAQRLVSDGIDVALDKWDLKEGNDLYNYMESMVKSPDINKVLIISDERYSKKADSRKGGVGAETQIISPEIYNNVSQEKFIPIVTEKDGDGKAFLPSYLKSRVYIDFSEVERTEESYEALLRNIFNLPSISKPIIGKPPSYLFDETPITFKTTHIVRNFEALISRNPNRINALIRDFISEFQKNLKEFTITFDQRDHISIGKSICDNINQYTPLRNDFISFFEKVVNSDLDFEIDIILRFLEDLPIFAGPLDDRSSWSDFEFSNYKIIIHELFIYFIAIGLKYEKYSFIEKLLYATYFPKDRYSSSTKAKNYDAFYGNSDVIKAYYNEINSRNFYCPMADLIIKRIPETYTKKQIVQADLICHYVAEINDFFWFPITYVYENSRNFDLFYKLESRHYFEKIKQLFSVENVDQLKEILTKLEDKENAMNRPGYPGAQAIIPLYRIIDIEKIGTKR